MVVGPGVKELPVHAIQAMLKDERTTIQQLRRMDGIVGEPGELQVNAVIQSTIN
jgi:hypothetical protein